MSTISGSQRANAQRPDVSLHLRSDADVKLWLLCRRNNVFRMIATQWLHYISRIYGVFIKYCVFPKNVVIFLNSASSTAALVFGLPLCTHTDTEGKPREARVRNIF